ncbi:unnamed protein product [Knipowitschia caucasica]|uniref:Uncharacterized protein n=1 Tax=Knipowitschia caucasica TaxID=637954 RepID=A0AAV2KWS3_KNICA
MEGRIICLVVLLGHYGGEAATPPLTTESSSSDDFLTTRAPPYSNAPTSTSDLEPCIKVSGKDLMELFNSPVYKAEWMVKPLEDVPVIVGPIAHSGVCVTLCDKFQWLIHNVAGEGTRVTRASHISDKWSILSPH